MLLVSKGYLLVVLEFKGRVEKSFAGWKCIWKSRNW
jgi:hypothetical protein